MKMKLKPLASSTLVLAAINQVYGQYAPPPPSPFPGFINETLRKNDPSMNKWDFGGNNRTRYESKQGFGIQGLAGSMDFRAHGPNTDNDYFLNRLRFHAGYRDKWWNVYAEGRSSTAISDDRYAYANNPAVAGTVKAKKSGPESDSIDLHQAYVTIGNHKEFPLSAKVGRQEMSYGEERLVGAFAWNNIGRVFDAAKLRWQNEWFGADFFVSRPVIPVDWQFNADNEYDYFSGVYATSTKIPKHTLDVYFLARNASPVAVRAAASPQFPQPSARDIYTIGGRLKSLPGQIGNWDYTVEGAYQFGDYRDPRLVVGGNSPRLEQDAFMFIAQDGYTFADFWATPRLGLEYDYASGDDNPRDGSHGTFENLFPTNHKFYGYMDFFSLQNVQDVRGILQLKPAPRVSLAIEGHGFWLANTSDNFYTVAGAPRGGIGTTPGNGYGINPNYSSFVGTEIDVIAGVAVNRLAVGEAPACVQACPHEAIRITLVETKAVEMEYRNGSSRREEALTFKAESGKIVSLTLALTVHGFLPTAPEPGYTLPTTRYKSSKPIPTNLFAGDHAWLAPSDSHLPLVFMLVLTQLSVGVSVGAIFAQPARWLALVSAVMGVIALGIASLHLGKPLKAWRAFLGWRKSWFSREVIVFSTFVPLAVFNAASFWLAPLAQFQKTLAVAVAVTGLLGVACSAMIYADTRREFWRASQCFGKFFGTAALLGAVTTLAVGAMTSSASNSAIAVLIAAMIVATVWKFSVENRVFRQRADCDALVLTPLNKTARLLENELGLPETAAA